MPFSKMREAILPLLPRIVEHPFNKELSEGTLPKRIFRFYVEQDALYLSDFGRALNLISKRCITPSHTKHFRLLADQILHTEKNLHLKYLGKYHSFNLFQDRRKPEKIPAVSNYTNHILNKAQNGTLEEAIASVMPCFWIYNHLGKKMTTLPSYHIHNPYYAWISSYSTEQFTHAGKKLIQIIEELESENSSYAQQNTISAFIQSTEYELLFWDSAYNKKATQCGLFY